MTETNAETERDYSKTLFLPQTDFPMRAGLPKKEPEILAHWDRIDLYKRQREDARGREKYVLHDGPPYANGNLHIGHALNKILKDIITRSFQMRGRDSNYVPGWDCHGLPIEWKIEEQYRKKGKNKDTVPINEFRQECRDFADHWIGIQSEEFKRLGVIGDFIAPYKTMTFQSEALIAGELMKFARSDQLYQGSKPVMWSIVEKTALAEAEVEYHDHESHTIWVKFPVVAGRDDLVGKDVIIWTTTPWTIPANRAICFNSAITYGLYQVTDAPEDNWARTGDHLIIADNLADSIFKAARVPAFDRLETIDPSDIQTCAHPFRGLEGGDGYFDFDVPMLDGDHVTDDAGTGFVHTAPGHGADDYEMFLKYRETFAKCGTDQVPHTVQEDGAYYPHVPFFEGKYILDRKGKDGSTNKAVIEKLSDCGALLARGRVKHSYPHSWRSKAPLIFRNTPQWFIAMDRNLGDGTTLRSRALSAIDETRFVPETGQNRLRSMIESRPDWVISRQRAWGVPITIFIRKDDPSDILQSDAVDQRILEAFTAEGADAWFSENATKRFLTGLVDNPSDWEKVDDILDVWFDSGSTHAFCLEQRDDLKWPADLYLEGSDQHRGWFHSSLLQGCGTRGRAPYNAVLTHGFTMAEDGRKMSKSLGNIIAPQDIIKQYGADILRLWVASADYSDDQRIGQEILKTNVDAYRKLRNTFRWMLGSLSHYSGETVAIDQMPELERLMLHELAVLDRDVTAAYDAFDFKRIVSRLFTFMTLDLSAFYFDVRKDALYCDAPSSLTRQAALQVIDRLHVYLTKWMAPLLPFTMEEIWQSRFGASDHSVHLEQFETAPADWQDNSLAEKWQHIRQLRRVVTGALEIERREKRIGSSLEAAPEIYVTDRAVLSAIAGADLAEIVITSQASLIEGDGPDHAFRLEGVSGIAVVPAKAVGRKCARSWKILPTIGDDPAYPDLSPRDAAAMRELDQVS